MSKTIECEICGLVYDAAPSIGPVVAAAAAGALVGKKALKSTGAAIVMALGSAVAARAIQAATVSACPQCGLGENA